MWRILSISLKVKAKYCSTESEFNDVPFCSLYFEIIDFIQVVGSVLFKFIPKPTKKKNHYSSGNCVIVNSILLTYITNSCIRINHRVNNYPTNLNARIGIYVIWPFHSNIKLLISRYRSYR